MDMFMQFRNTVYSCLPHADIVADKYHVIRQANWRIGDVRIRLFNSDIKYKEYKKYWKLIAKNPNSTFSPLAKETEEPFQRYFQGLMILGQNFSVYLK